MKKYRHPKEKRAMLVTFGLAIIISIFFATVTLGCGLFILGLAFAWGYFAFSGKNNLERLHKVSPNTNPQIWQTVEKVRQKWGIADLDVYFHPTSNINASASDFGKNFIIINQGLWQAIRGEAQRKFVIGHELGHIGLGHSWLSVIAYQADNAFAGTILSFFFQFILLRYSRMKELSADRIGLLTCGSLDAALEALAILELRKPNPQEPEIDAMVNYLKSRKASLSENLSETFSTHPDISERVEELMKFSKRVGLDKS
ncbi:MAG: M48 family metallopeptidase [Chloroflexi bacterium]|nr:M48 family metallopeptidase [Chloroflexota bacterium]MBT3670977.1 M48 family metallopeptidase [Chloroflexota bacterium]MBT4001744.1 M48 family metallopeptidase [Chloroflexota bacterium]MBT4305010.1 M48 family metallopeptidase [Chloroflexota bacterium]MBT4533821.1 M48 family metallopeptidase [Chloroflexota bacterium]